MAYWCYIIKNIDERYGNKTYCGFTVNPQRRIRQHNKEIKGGAKATRLGTWEFIFLMTGFETSNNALSCEWRLKHPEGKRKKNKKYFGVSGRIHTINDVLKLEKWTNKCNILNTNCEYIVFVATEIYEKLNVNVPQHIIIIDVDNPIDIF